eukprot:5258152-Prymnesium_polylepis.1
MGWDRVMRRRPVAKASHSSPHVSSRLRSPIAPGLTPGLALSFKRRHELGNLKLITYHTLATSHHVCHVPTTHQSCQKASSLIIIITA